MVVADAPRFSVTALPRAPDFVTEREILDRAERGGRISSADALYVAVLQ